MIYEGNNTSTGGCTFVISHIIFLSFANTWKQRHQPVDIHVVACSDTSGQNILQTVNEIIFYYELITNTRVSPKFYF